MNFIVRRVADKGVKNKERVVLFSEADIDIGQYMLFDTTYLDDGEVSSKLRHSFWFPDIDVEAGDLVVLYTKSGKKKIKKNDDGSRTIFLYWGLDITVWNKSEDCAVLVKIDDWELKKIP